MKLIKQMANDIAGNIEEARDKIRTAYELRKEYPEAAAWYREMAVAHLDFNRDGHQTITQMIEKYKASDDYKRKPEYADGMMTVWKAIHEDLIAKSAEVRAMIEGYK